MAPCSTKMWKKLCSFAVSWIVLTSFKAECQITSSQIDQLVRDFTADLQDEKNNVPITERVAWEQLPESINAAVEGTADTQRYFEYIANRTNMHKMNNNQLNSMYRALDNSQEFQNLLQRCRAGFRNPTCDSSSLYRTYDGTCNNLRNPNWGSLFECHRRLLPQSYVGLSGFRQSVLGGELPDVRMLSLNIMPHVNRPTPYLSHMFTFYGQLLTHDVTDTPLTKVNGLELLCCPAFVNTTYNFPECAGMFLQPNDPFFSQPSVNQSCLQFVRHSPCRTCGFTKREQMNTVTGFIDTHFTYGRTQAESDSLRTNDGSGHLITQDSTSGPLLPPNISEDDLFCLLNMSACFRGGDARTNQHSVLMAMQTLLVREHNRLADQLKQLNQHWTEETIYQTARKIVGAKMQVIAYKEYLPLLLGQQLMSRYNLWINSGYKYNSNMDPSVSSEFQAFAFRLHSVTNSQIGSMGCSRSLLRDLFRQPEPIHQGCTGDYLQGSCRTPSQQFDRFMVEDLTDFNLRIPGTTYGNDIAATHIKRGRDDGIPPYVDIVEYLSYGEIRIRSFQDLRTVMTPQNVQILQRNYRHVRDIDAWVGMQLEDILVETQVSSTAAYLIAEQFERLKFGDRFFFENPGQKWSFSKSQMQELRKNSLSRMICDNTEATEMPVNAQLQPYRSNSVVSCQNLASVNINAWAEY